jgi:hypothetical protein
LRAGRGCSHKAVDLDQDQRRRVRGAPIMSADGGMDIPKLPPCQRCGRELELATLISARGDRPTTYVFKCPQCKRHAQYYRNEGGELRQW